MNTSAFVDELLTGLANIVQVHSVDLRTEGPIVSGRAHLGSESFLAFYFNQVTGTEAFALVKGKSRAWGIDFDNLRGWHVHPLQIPDEHVPTGPQTVAEIMSEFARVLRQIEK